MTKTIRSRFVKCIPALAFLPAAAALAGPAQSPALEAELNCMDAIEGKSIGAPTRLEDDLLLVPASRNGRNGIYLFTRKGAYFHEVALGKDGQTTRNHLEIRVPGKERHYINLQQIGMSGASGSTLVSETPAPAKGAKYRVLSGGDALDDASRAVLTRELITRIGSVAEHYDRTLRMSDAGIRKDLPRDMDKLYREALLKCSRVETPSVREATKNEILRIPHVTPFTSGAATGGSAGDADGAAAAK